MAIAQSLSQYEEEDSFNNATSSDDHMHMHNGMVSLIDKISYHSESKDANNLKNETSDISANFHGLAQDLDADIMEVSTLLGNDHWSI